MEQNMPVTYTTTTNDEPEYKALLCGRTNDITTLIDHVAKRNSVAMFGERKIGKTSVLYLIRDIINSYNGSIIDYQTKKAYQAKLIDSDLKNKISGLQAKIPTYKSCYISFSSFENYNFAEFVMKLHREGKNLGLRVPTLNHRDIDIFARLNNAYRQGRSRLVVLLDDIEVLEHFPSQERTKVVRNLKSATTHTNLCFIIAGAEKWYDTLGNDIAPLSTVLQTHNLSRPFQASPSQSPPPQESIMLHLIREPLKDYLSSQDLADEVAATVEEWTGYKPFFVQTVCDFVVEIYQEQNQLPPDWKTRVKEKVLNHNDTAREVLKQSYGNENIDVLARESLALLARVAPLTTKQITRQLKNNTEETVVQEKLDDLKDLGKIDQQQDQKYYIVGTLFQEWIHQHSSIKSRRRRIAIKLSVVIGVLILGTVLALIYANPRNVIKSVKFADYTVDLVVPSSLEEDETGTIEVSVQNNSPKAITSIVVTLTSADIDYQWGDKDKSSRLTFTPLEIGEKKFLSPTFTVHPSPSNSNLTSNVIITEDGKPSSPIQTFDTTKRWFPIRKFAVLGNSVLTVLTAIVVFWKEISSRLFSEKSDNTKSKG
jgi:hypothetical protein